MPELPEVEIVKQSLYKNIKSKKIKKVIIKNPNLRFKLPNNFSSILKNSKIKNITRFSKYIIMNIDNGYYCILHLGMSGTIHIFKKKSKNLITNLSFYNSPFLPKKHNHIELIFDNLRVIYNDPRRFGFFKIFSDKNNLLEYLSKYGPEPFDRKFNINYLKIKLKGKSKNIKNYLLDQNFVSGIGNIYASEILFLCKINPFTKSGKLTLREYKKIIFYSKYVLNDAIRKGGSTIQNFVNTEGGLGSFQNHFKVYGRCNLKCLVKKCNGIIKKKTISNRSTFYCNICQK